jgi:hypothetical protein
LNLAPRLAAALQIGAPATFDMWLAATRWWTAPALDIAQLGWEEMSERILRQLSDGLVAGFASRPLELVVDGSRVRARMKSVELARGPDGLTARLELADAAVDGLEVESLSLVVRSLGLTSPPDCRLTADAVAITGEGTVEQVVAWLDGRVGGWRLAVEGDERVVAAARGRGRAKLLVDAFVDAGALRVAVVGARWGRLRLPWPRWMRPTRAMSLPPGPSLVCIDDARRCGDRVRFRATMPAVSRRVDLAQVRDAVSRGAALALG